MIGIVTSGLKAAVHVFLLDASGELQETEVFVDIGMRLLEGSALNVEVRIGGSVTIEPPA